SEATFGATFGPPPSIHTQSAPATAPAADEIRQTTTRRASPRRAPQPAPRARHPGHRHDPGVGDGVAVDDEHSNQSVPYAAWISRVGYLGQPLQQTRDLADYEPGMLAEPVRSRRDQQ
ncbi:hypothetical protein ABZ372_54055, partial [Streptomyces sp. NPDC005921]